MEDIKKIQEFFSKPLEEVTKSQMLKKAKKGSYPATLVAIENGKVIAQEKVNTPQEAPAAHSVMSKKYPNANIRLEDSTGKILEEGKQLDQVDFAKVVKAVEQTGHPVTVLLVPKFNEIEVLTGMDAPDDMLRDLSNAVDSLGYGRNDIFIAADSSNLSRREYSDIRRVNGGAKDYFEESLNENEDPIVVKYFKRGDNYFQILVKYEKPVGFTTALGSRTALGQQNDQNEAAAQKRVKSIVNNLKADFDLDEIFVEEGQVAGRYYINAFSDDFIDIDADYLKNNLSEATKEEETEFHKKLDKLVHDTFGKRKGELEEGASTEEKRIAKRAIRSIAKYRGVSEDEARNDLIRAAKELGSLKEDMSLDDQAKAYYLAKVKRGEIDTLPEDPKAAFLAQMMKDQISHDKETLRRERGLEETAAYIAETIKLGMMVNEELCEKGKRYIKARQAAGEKSSAYLSGRAVRVCKGQIEWPKKGKKKK